MALFPSDISRLIYYHLLNEGYENTAATYSSECPHLKGFHENNKKNNGRKYSRMIGPSLTELLEEYFCTKDIVTEQLDSVEDTNPVRPQDSLPTLTTHIFSWFKTRISAGGKAGIQTSDVSTVTDSLTVETVKKDAEIQVNEDEFFNDSSPEPSPQPFDFSTIYENLIENEELHRRIAENINEVITKTKTSNEPAEPLVSNSSSSNLSQDLSNAVKTIAEKTQADPIFEEMILSLIGRNEPPDHREETFNPISDETVNPVVETGLKLPSPIVEETFNRVGETGLKSPAPETEQTFNPVMETGLKSPSPIQQVSTFPAVETNLVTLLPGLQPFAFIPADSVYPPIVSVPNLTKQTKPRLRRIMPKVAEPPKVTSAENLMSPLRAALRETIPECQNEVGKFGKEFILQPTDPQQPAITLRVLSPEARDREVAKNAELQKSVPKKVLMRETRKKGKLSGRSQQPIKTQQQPEVGGGGGGGGVSAMFRELLSITSEYCKNNQEDSGSVVATAVTSESSAESIEDPPTTIHKTPPTVRKKQTGHVRQLDFGKSPRGKSSPAQPMAAAKSASPTYTTPEPPISVRDPPLKTWDAALRTALSSSHDDSVFATPRGKAKRACPKQKSPNCNLPPTEKATNDVAAPSEETPPPSLTTNDSVTNETSAVETSNATSTASTDTPSAPESTSPSVLASSPPQDESRISPGSITGSMPSLATPQKFPEASSNSSWNTPGVPLTPRVILEGNTTSSPYLFSFTKGFGFLNDNPVLATPSTPSIRCGSDSKTSELALNTPRVELLRQEAATSSALGTCTISPTQVVVGRSTAYFVPSGERARRPESAGVTPERRPDDPVSERKKPWQSEGIRVISEETLETILVGVCSDLEKRETEVRKKSSAQSKLVELFGEESISSVEPVPEDRPITIEKKEKRRSKEKPKEKSKIKNNETTNEHFIEQLLAHTRKELAVEEHPRKRRRESLNQSEKLPPVKRQTRSTRANQEKPPEKQQPISKEKDSPKEIIGGIQLRGPIRTYSPRKRKSTGQSENRAGKQQPINEGKDPKEVSHKIASVETLRSIVQSENSVEKQQPMNKETDQGTANQNPVSGKPPQIVSQSANSSEERPISRKKELRQTNQNPVNEKTPQTVSQSANGAEDERSINKEKDIQQANQDTASEESPPILESDSLSGKSSSPQKKTPQTDSQSTNFARNKQPIKEDKDLHQANQDTAPEKTPPIPESDSLSGKSSSSQKKTPFPNLQKFCPVLRPPLGRKAVSLKQSLTRNYYSSPRKISSSGKVLEEIEEAVAKLHGETESTGNQEPNSSSALQDPSSGAAAVQDNLVNTTRTEPDTSACREELPSTDSSAAQSIAEEPPSEITNASKERESSRDPQDPRNGRQSLKILAAAATPSGSQPSTGCTSRSPSTLPKKTMRNPSRSRSLENYLQLMRFDPSASGTDSQDPQKTKSSEKAKQIAAEMQAFSRNLQKRLREKHIDLFSN